MMPIESAKGFYSSAVKIFAFVNRYFGILPSPFAALAHIPKFFDDSAQNDLNL
jgi:hypothetical protein